MPTVKISLADHIDTQIDTLIEQGEFMNREQAVEDLLSMGMSAYDGTEQSIHETEEELFTQTLDDQQDPALWDEPEE